MLKVDFERAYDTVNWNFLEYMMRRMGFDQHWLEWMRACIFNSSMSVLVNGSPTEDFLVGKGLRQGDPLSPFLFLIAAEGLTRLMQKAVDNSSFHGFKVRDDLHFHTLQFADDTVLIGEGNWDNLWSIKTVLRSFELVSGLKVNFFKSKLYGINLDDNFLSAASSFLHCEVDSIPFRFLGIPVGANPRRKITWNPIVEAMKKRLNAWNGRHLSIGGRVTLINSSLFPILFNKALYPNIVVGASGMWQDHTWVWKIEWSSVLSAAEQELAQELDTLLTGFFPYPNDKDRVRWNIHQTGQFSVQSTYVFLLSRVVTLAIDENVVEALNQLWTNDMPSKVSIFGWRLLLSRLPTRMALAKKGVIVNPRELCCAFCFREEEDIDHVFFNCSFSQQIWKGIFVWLNVDFIPYEVCWQHFISFGALVKNKSYAKARHVIWLATTWSLWRARNNIMFRGDVINLQSLVNQIIYISWFWFVGRITSKSSLVFSDWCKDPLSCIFSI
ncbi:unnamed protein product [Trifolium pratense]|uniref:Uncharacterized protein n=1 Tax=Trifolium pratense TaxID=57577 RepID=A0ACB0JBQ0_TRIPR|nr:unnamed protein product [Trifolium pratense]